MVDIRGKGFVGSWDPSEFIKDTEGRLAKGIAKAVPVMERHAKKLLSEPGPTKTTPVGTVVKGGLTVRASFPGEPPRKRTGTLRASVRAQKVDDAGTTWRVGTPLKYGLWLELGTRRGLEPRPWLRRSLNETKGEMAKIINRVLKGGE